MPETLSRDIKVLSGWAFPSDGFNELEGLPLIRIRDLGRSTTEVKFKGRYDPKYVINDGDVLIGMDGDFSVEKWAGGPALLNQRVCKVESASGDLDQSFLYWYLMPHVAEIHRKTPQTTVRHLSASSLGEIAAPPLSFTEQRTVNRILDTLDTTIRQTKAIIEKLKQVKQGLLHDLLTRGIDANGELRPPQSQAPHLYKDSPLGWIPREWSTLTLASLCARVIDGTHFTPTYTERGVPFLRVTDLHEQSIDPRRTKYISASEHRVLTKRCRPEIGDVLLSKNGTVGIARVVDWAWEFSIFVSLALLKLRPECGMDSKLLETIINSPVIAHQIQRRSKQGTVTNLHLEEIREFSIPRPPGPEQREILERLGALTRRIESERATLEKLQTMKSGLMDDLLTGRVRVTPLLVDRT